jgi:zinc protease
MPAMSFPRLRASVGRALPAVLALSLACASSGARNEPAPPPAAAAGAAAAGPAPVVVATAAGPVQKIATVEGITEYRLANGLRVLLYPDASKPTFTVNLTVFVGSRHEGYGESGMAHLLEHMLFKGTARHPDIWKLLQERGAKFNGTTWWDRTNYYEELPVTPENLEFAIGLEADRMIASRISGEDLTKEFSVVRNEFEMGENNPPGVLEEKMFSVAFQWHNYGKTTIGSRSDIERVPVENLRAFYRKHYQPDNAMLIVAGKFEAPRALELVQKHFGPIPRPARALERTWTQEPPQDGERVVTLRRAGDVAVVAVLYHTVAGADPDWLASDALSDILANKPAGRLYKALVDKGLASEVWSTVYPTAEPGVLIAGAKVRPGGSPEKVREALLKVTEGVGASTVEESEVARWRTKTAKQFELWLTDTASVGVALSDWAAMGDWRLFFHTRDRVKAVTPADVARVAKSFLKESNRTVGVFLPTKAPDRPPLVGLPDVPAVMKDFKAKETADEGEAFVASIDNIEARVKRWKMPSGLKVALLSKKTKGGAVRVALTVRWGAERDVKGRLGATSIIAQMLLRGTKKRTFQQIKDELDRLKAEVRFGGGRFNVSTPNVTIVDVLTVRENLPAVLGLLAELLKQPAFPPAELETLRKEQIAQLEEQLQDPMANGFLTMLQRVYPWPRDDVRHVPSVKETIEELKKVKVADVARLHRTLWGASAAQISAVGDVDEAAFKGIVDKELGSWKSPAPYERIARPYRDGEVKQDAIDTPDKQMAFVGVAHALDVRMDDPDYPALVLLNHILGGSASSRLLDRLRQKEGLSYGAFSGIQAPPLDRSGFFFAGAICAPQNADKAMTALLEEIDKILKTGVPDAELADAKKSHASTWDNQLAEDQFVVTELNQGLFLDRTFKFWKDVNERIQKLTAADLLAAAKKHLRPDKLAKIKAGDLSKKS